MPLLCMPGNVKLAFSPLPAKVFHLVRSHRRLVRDITASLRASQALVQEIEQKVLQSGSHSSHGRGHDSNTRGLSSSRTSLSSLGPSSPSSPTGHNPTNGHGGGHGGHGAAMAVGPREVSISGPSGIGRGRLSNTGSASPVPVLAATAGHGHLLGAKVAPAPVPSSGQISPGRSNPSTPPAKPRPSPPATPPDNRTSATGMAAVAEARQASQVQLQGQGQPALPSAETTPRAGGTPASVREVAVLMPGEGSRGSQPSHPRGGAGPVGEGLELHQHHVGSTAAVHALQVNTTSIAVPLPGQRMTGEGLTALGPIGEGTEPGGEGESGKQTPVMDDGEQIHQWNPKHALGAAAVVASAAQHARHVRINAPPGMGEGRREAFGRQRSNKQPPPPLPARVPGWTPIQAFAAGDSDEEEEERGQGSQQRGGPPHQPKQAFGQSIEPVTSFGGTPLAQKGRRASKSSQDGEEEGQRSTRSVDKKVAVLKSMSSWVEAQVRGGG